MRVLFDRALVDEPPPPPGDLAQEAMAGGRRLRRRRHLLAGGAASVVTVLAAVLALNVADDVPTVPVVMSSSSPPATHPACTRETMVVVLLLRYDVTDQQRADLDEALRADPRVVEVRYASDESAYARFMRDYHNTPGAGGGAAPEAFHVRIERKDWKQVDEYGRRPGVYTAVMPACPTAAVLVPE